MYTRHEEIRKLFDETIARFKKLNKPNYRDYQFFCEVMGDTAVRREAFLCFLHDVSTCPPDVIQWCQRQVNQNRLRMVK